MCDCFCRDHVRGAQRVCSPEAAPLQRRLRVQACSARKALQRALACVLTSGSACEQGSRARCCFAQRRRCAPGLLEPLPPAGGAQNSVTSSAHVGCARLRLRRLSLIAGGRKSRVSASTAAQRCAHVPAASKRCPLRPHLRRRAFTHTKTARAASGSAARSTWKGGRNEGVRTPPSRPFDALNFGRARSAPTRAPPRLAGGGRPQ